MAADALRPLVQDALDALRAFLATLLNAEAPLEASAPVREAAPEAPEGALLLLGRPEGAPSFAVAFDAGWVELLAQAMLGGSIPMEEAGDLLGEVAGQAYGALRTQFGAGGARFPEATFESGTSEGLEEVAPAWRVPFSLPHGEDVLHGAVFLAEAVVPSTPKAPSEPEAQSTSEAPSGAPAPGPAAAVEVAPAAFEDFGRERIGDGRDGHPSLHFLSDVELEVTVELGRRRLPLAEVLRLTTGSVVELEKLVGQPLEVYANDRLIAEGEAVVIDDQFGVRITSLAARPGLGERAA